MASRSLKRSRKEAKHGKAHPRKPRSHTRAPEPSQGGSAPQHHHTFFCATDQTTAGAQYKAPVPLHCHTHDHYGELCIKARTWLATMGLYHSVGSPGMKSLRASSSADNCPLALTHHKKKPKLAYISPSTGSTAPAPALTRRTAPPWSPCVRSDSFRASTNVPG